MEDLKWKWKIQKNDTISRRKKHKTELTKLPKKVLMSKFRIYKRKRANQDIKFTIKSLQ